MVNEELIENEVEGIIFTAPSEDHSYSIDVGEYFAENYGSLANTLDCIIHGSATGDNIRHCEILKELLRIFESTSERELSISIRELHSICTKQLSIVEQRYTPSSDVKIMGDFKQIIFPDGYAVNLAPAHVRRSIVRFIRQHVEQTGNPVFYIEEIRELHKKENPERSWESIRFKEDLFKGHSTDFEYLFESTDSAAGRYRLKF